MPKADADGHGRLPLRLTQAIRGLDEAIAAAIAVRDSLAVGLSEILVCDHDPATIRPGLRHEPDPRGGCQVVLVFEEATRGAS